MDWALQEEAAERELEQQPGRFIQVAANVQTNVVRPRQRNWAQAKAPRVQSSLESPQQPRSWSVERLMAGAPNALAAGGSHARRPKLLGGSAAATSLDSSQVLVSTPPPPPLTSSPAEDLRAPHAQVQLDSSHEQQWGQARVHLGETARLLCRLRASAQDSLQISWVKSVQILTNGEQRYTSDERFKPVHLQHSNDWVLEIHNAQASDEGDYECQVNSEPRPASLRVHLRVVSARLEILEAPELQVAEGEQIQLTCQLSFLSPALGQPQGQASPASNSTGAALTRKSRATVGLSSAPQQQHYIYWFKDNASLEYNNPRGDIEIQRRSDETRGLLESSLLVSEATKRDTGLYACKLFPELAHVRPAQVQVLVGASAASAASDRLSLVGHWRLGILLPLLPLLLPLTHRP